MVPDPTNGRPRATAAELRRPQVVLGVAVWTALFALLLVLSAR